MDQTDRRRGREGILDLLKQQGGLTASTLAERLDVTPVAIRKHLDALEREGLVNISSVKQPRGRPTLVYHLTAAANERFPQGYQQLAIDLIDDLVAIEGESSLERLLQIRNERLRRRHFDEAGQSTEDRVLQLAKLRNADGYMVTVEDRGNAYAIQEHNCPIYEVASRFPVACQCEADLFRQVVNLPVVRESSIVDGDESCTYLVPKEGD